VKAYIKDRPSIKAIQKSLISYLSQGQLAIIVTSIHILASLCLYDDLGESLFNSKNVDQTFQVAFNVLLKSPTYQPKARAVDLLVDISSPNLLVCLLFHNTMVTTESNVSYEKEWHQAFLHPIINYSLESQVSIMFHL